MEWLCFLCHYLNHLLFSPSTLLTFYQTKSWFLQLCKYLNSDLIEYVIIAVIKPSNINIFIISGNVFQNLINI